MADVASLNDTLQRKKDEKYDYALETEIRLWVGELVKREEEFTDAGNSLQELLKNGEVLCDIMNGFAPGVIPRVNRSKLAFKQMENLSHYLKACEKVGLKQTALFQTIDLFEGKDMGVVITALNQLRQHATKHNNDLSSFVQKVSSAAPKGPSAARISATKSAPDAAKRRWSWKAKSEEGAQTAQPKHTVSSGVSATGSITVNAPSVSSLEDDIKTKEAFKFSSELARKALRWISAVLEEEDIADQSFHSCLKTGEVLCRLLNRLKAGSISKIHGGTIAYRHMENIGNYLKACKGIGLPVTDLFDTPDLYEEKNLNLVVQHVHSLAAHVKKNEQTFGFSGPFMEDSSKVRTLYAASLVDSGLDFNNDDIEVQPLTEKQEELVKWVRGKARADRKEWTVPVNSQLAKAPEGSAMSVSNLSKDMRNGVALIKLLGVLTKLDKIGAYIEEPSMLWHCMQNAALILRFTTQQTFEKVDCTAPDIVLGDVDSISRLLVYLREKFDLDYLFLKVLNEGEDEEMTLDDLAAYVEEEEQDEYEYVYEEDATATSDDAMSTTSDVTDDEGRAERSNDRSDPDAERTVSQELSEEERKRREKEEEEERARLEKEKKAMEEERKRMEEEKKRIEEERARKEAERKAEMLRLQQEKEEEERKRREIEEAEQRMLEELAQLEKEEAERREREEAEEKARREAEAKALEEERKRKAEEEQKRAEAERKERERLAEEKRQREQQERERLEAARVQREKEAAIAAEKERLRRLAEEEERKKQEELERAEREREEAEYRAHLEKLEKERQEAERREKEKQERERKELEERLRLEKEQRERELQERLAREEAERKEKERLAREAAERAEKERLEKEERERQERYRREREEAERLERERIAKEEAERKERFERERKEAAERERQRKIQEEKERQERFRREREELERKERERREKEEAERKAREEKERLEAERKERERREREEAERKERERLQREEEERLERERLAREERERKEAEERARKEREEAERQERIRLAKIKSEQERKRKEEEMRKERERLEREEKERLERERLAREEAARLERERKQREEEERLEQLRIEREQREAAERAERERLEREKREREEREREEAERRAKEELERQLAELRERERLAAEEAERKERERLQREEAERQERARKAAEEAARREAERKAKEEEERKEREKREREEAEKERLRILAEQEAERQRQREEAEKAARLEQERIERELAAIAAAERKAAEEAAAAERARIQQLEEEARKEREKLERLQREREERERKQREQREAEEKARQEQAKAEEEKRAREAAEQEKKRAEEEERLRKENEEREAKEREERDRREAEEKRLEEERAEKKRKLEEERQKRASEIAKRKERIRQLKEQREKAEREQREKEEAERKALQEQEEQERLAREKEEKLRIEMERMERALKRESVWMAGGGRKAASRSRRSVIGMKPLDGASEKGTAEQAPARPARPAASPAKGTWKIVKKQVVSTPSKTVLGRDKAQRVAKAQAAVRIKVAKELLETERSYVASMNQVVELLVAPIQASTKRGMMVLNEKELFEVFGNLEQLWEHHKGFLAGLEERMSTFDESTVLGSLFLEKGDFFPEYGPFMENYNVSLIALYYQCKKNERFREMVDFFERAQMLTTKLNLESFLIMPVQRLPRYVLLLRDMRKYTPKSHPDHELLGQAIEFVSGTLGRLNKNINSSESEDAHKLLSIAQHVEGDQDQIVRPGRRYVREGLVKVKRKEKGSRRSVRMGVTTVQSQAAPARAGKTYCFLFHDMLVQTEQVNQKRMVDDGEKPFVFTALIYLRNVTGVKDLESKKIRLDLGAAANWELKFASSEEKQLWEADLRKHVDEAAYKGDGQ